jgi:NMD protein affecting ribosome stability and mRNA decay
MIASDPGHSVVRTPVGGACPACGAEELAEYPVVSTGGWFRVVKCQQCLSSISRERWHRLGDVDRDDAERVAGMAKDVVR